MKIRNLVIIGVVAMITVIGIFAAATLSEKEIYKGHYVASETFAVHSFNETTHNFSLSWLNDTTVFDFEYCGYGTTYRWGDEPKPSDKYDAIQSGMKIITEICRNLDIPFTCEFCGWGYIINSYPLPELEDILTKTITRMMEKNRWDTD